MRVRGTINLPDIPVGGVYTDNGLFTVMRTVTPLGDFYGDVTTVGTSPEILQTTTLPVNTFSANGDEVRITYRGTYATDDNTKRTILYLDVDSYFDTGLLTKNGGAWKLEVEMMRVGVDKIDIHINYHDSTTTLVYYSEFVGMDFTQSTEWHFEATTSEAAGDLILHTCKAIFIPATTVVGGSWTLLGERWVLDGKPWVFNP
jgi:hypothetical protein